MYNSTFYNNKKSPTNAQAGGSILQKRGHFPLKKINKNTLKLACF